MSPCCRRVFASRSAIAFSLALIVPLVGCGDSGMSGVYVSTRDPEDRIEFVSGSKAKITAIAGRRLDVWEMGGRAQTELGRAMQDARRALARFETVEVSYKFVDERTVEFSAPGRGSRTVRYDKAADMLEGWGRGAYFKRPS